MITKAYLNDLTYEVLGAAIQVHKTLGRGLVEGVYHQCMKAELKHRKINFGSEIMMPLTYRDVKLDVDFRCNLFVEKCLVVELKSVSTNMTLFEAQLLTYMKLLQAPKGVIINFNCNHIFREGQKTYVNEYFRLLSDD